MFWPRVGSPLVSISDYSGPIVCPTIHRYGWAMEDVNLVEMDEMKTPVNFHIWRQSIHNHENQSCLRTLGLDASSLDSEENRKAVFSIVQRSPALRYLTLHVDILDDVLFVDRARWCLTRLGPKITSLSILVQNSTIPPEIASFICREMLPKVIALQVIFDNRGGKISVQNGSST